jgi:SAM-dependent methyltransferase
VTLFDQYAQNYNEGHAKAVKSTGFQPSYFHEYKIREVAAQLKARGLDSQDMNLLNVGCGIGESEPYIREYLPRVTVFGIDVSEKSIDVARESNRELPGVTYAAYDGEHIPFDISFDIVFVANVFHHIRRENHLMTLKILHQRLKDKGLIFLFEHNPLNPLTLWIAYRNDYRFDKDSRLLNPRYAGRILLKTGFTEVEPRYTIFFPNHFSFLLPLEKHLSKLPFGAHYYYVGRK